jgi:hypothetical protein
MPSKEQGKTGAMKTVGVRSAEFIPRDREKPHTHEKFEPCSQVEAPAE